MLFTVILHVCIFIRYFFRSVAETGMIYINHADVYESPSGEGCYEPEKRMVHYHTHGNGIPGRNKQCRGRAEPTLYNNNGLHTVIGTRPKHGTRRDRLERESWRDRKRDRARERGDDDDDNNNPIATHHRRCRYKCVVVCIC